MSLGSPDRLLQSLKRLHRRWYLADYEDERLRRHWVRTPPDAPFVEHVVPVRPDPASISSLLVFKPDEIGDAVYALPAIRELRRHLPQARLFLVCQPLTKPIYERTGLFDEIATVDVKLRLGRFPSLALGSALHEFSVREFDASIYLRTYPASFRSFLKVPSRARIHPIDPLMRSDSVYRAPVSLWGEQRRHQALQLLEIVSLLTGRPYSFRDVTWPEFHWTDEDRRAEELVFPAGRPASYVVVHPFAKHETRRYPYDYWTRLLRRLEDDLAARLVVIGGPGDPRLPGLDGALQVQGRLALGQTGYLLSRASAFLGNLSGPGHWAAALGVPTVTLMGGHSLPGEWAPLGRSLVLRADVPCAPCHQRTCPVYGLACLTELRPERVYPEIAEFLRPHLDAEDVPSTLHEAAPDRLPSSPS